MSLTTSAHTRRLSLVAVAIAALALVGCAPATSEPVAPIASDVWIKAQPELMDGMAMTGLFGTFKNPTDEDITLLGGVADQQWTDTKLDAHEVVKNDAGEMVMQEAKGGIVIPAHGSVTLKPGGYHVMFWDLKKPIAVGDTVKATIEFSNGTSIEVDAVAREIANANEHYDDSAE